MVVMQATAMPSCCGTAVHLMYTCISCTPWQKRCCFRELALQLPTDTSLLISRHTWLTRATKATEQHTAAKHKGPPLHKWLRRHHCKPSHNSSTQVQPNPPKHWGW
jgi:hypothetical protein